MCYDIWINLLSNFLYSLLLFGIVYGIYLLTKRVKFMKFFGIDKTKRLIIFTSNLQVKENGAEGKNGFIYSFRGTAIPYAESRAAAKFQSLFNYFLPSQVEKPGFISKLLISDTDINVVPAPTDKEPFEKSASIIALGLPAYNTISDYIEEKFNPSAKLDYLNATNNFSVNTTGTVILASNPLGKLHNEIAPDDFNGSTGGTATPANRRTKPTWESISSASVGITSPSAVPHSRSGQEQPCRPAIRISNIEPFTDISVGFVQKIIDTENNRYIFYVAGLSENSTAGSAYFLISNWKELNKKYGSNTPFHILLKVSEKNNQESEIILEK